MIELKGAAMNRTKTRKPKKLSETEKRRNLRALVTSLGKLKPDKGKKWISQEHHDKVPYG
jgi:hypothetical protein